MCGGVETAEQCCDAKYQKRRGQDPDARGQAGQHAEAGADKERGPPPIAARDPAGRQRAHPHTDDVNRDGQGREAAIGRQHRTHDGPGRNENRVVAAR
jgi:hypothetical protein